MQLEIQLETSFDIGERVIVTSTGEEAIIKSIKIHLQKGGYAEIYSVRFGDGTVLHGLMSKSISPAPSIEKVQ